MQKIEKVLLSLILMVMIFFMLTIGIRFSARQILVERLGMDNSLTHFIFSDNPQMGVDGEDAEVSVNIDWAGKYPFSKSNTNNGAHIFSAANDTIGNFKSKILDIEGKIETYTSDLLFGYQKMVDMSMHIKGVLKGVSTDSLIGDVYVMQNGYLTYKEEKQPENVIIELADSVESLNSFLEAKNIPLIYVNAGSKVCPYNTMLSPVAEEHSNENGDALISELSKRNIDVIDMRTEMIDAGFDWYDSYYITDHHWKTELGLWSAGIIAERLNSYGFEYDLKKFENEQNNIAAYPKLLFGGQGRSVTFANADLEDYSLITPKYETEFEITVPTRSVTKIGSFENTLINKEKIDEIYAYSESDHLSKSDAYNIVTARNDAYSEIRNLNQTNNTGKKVLFLSDSFAWYTRPFLACDTEIIDSIYLTSFNGSLETFIDEECPDAVVVMYCERNIDEVDWNLHSSLFDFR